MRAQRVGTRCQLELHGNALKMLARSVAGFTGGLARRVVACLDVRSNDAGDLVVTKGDQYDVREKGDSRGVRNLGKPVELCKRYYEDGADEVTFLNITGFRDFPLADLPMLEVRRVQRADACCMYVFKIATLSPAWLVRRAHACIA